MLLYSVNAITAGSTESQGEVTVRLSARRAGSSTASAPTRTSWSRRPRPTLRALNKLHSKTERVAAQG